MREEGDWILNGGRIWLEWMVMGHTKSSLFFFFFFFVCREESECASGVRMRVIEINEFCGGVLKMMRRGI